MRTALAIATVIFLTACGPVMERLRPQSPGTPQPVPVPVSTDSGAVDITPEPFTDPLAPESLRGSVAVQERTLSGGILEIGEARARASMDLFLNAESPYAREFQRSRMPLLLQEFVGTGDLKIRLFILPIEKYAGSAESARAIGCAAEQGKGYPTLDLLFSAERTTVTQDDATELELDALLFQNCVQTQRSDPLAPSRAAAKRLGVTLVPAYALDEEVFVGLPTEADLLGAVRQHIR